MTLTPVRTMALTEAPAAIAAPTATPEQLELIKRTVPQGAPQTEPEPFFYDCARRGVHPLDKLIHFTKRAGKYTPVTSIDFMRSRAAMTGDYAGSDDAVFVNTPKSAEFAATVTVYRFGHEQKCAFSATARWPEYRPLDHDFMWQKMPYTMLGKCAEALALRKGFPAELSGLYEAAELDQASTEAINKHTGEITEAEPAKLITAAQRKRLFAIAQKSGWSTEQVKDALLELFQLASTSAIPASRYDDVCDVFSQAPPAPEPDTPF